MTQHIFISSLNVVFLVISQLCGNMSGENKRFCVEHRGNSDLCKNDQSGKHYFDFGKKTAAGFFNLQRFAMWNANLKPSQTLVFYFGAGLLCSLQPAFFWPSCILVYLLPFGFTFSFTLSLRSNRAGLTKRDFPIGYNFGILLWITSIQVC